MPYLNENSSPGTIPVEEPMTDEVKAELNRVAGVFENWAKLHKARVKAAVDFGYGITDSLGEREASELDGAIASLRTIAGP